MLYENDKLTEKELAIKLYKDVEKIKVAKKKLSDKGYLIDSRVSITGEKILKEHEIENAIILAAGMSTRFVPLSFEKPKGLLKVKGQVLIERQILQLREKGIDEIIIVVRYMKEQFKYLIDKFGVIFSSSSAMICSAFSILIFLLLFGKNKTNPAKSTLFLFR